MNHQAWRLALLILHMYTKTTLDCSHGVGSLEFWRQGLLNLGLHSIESARAAFITETSVVMTPVVSAISGHRVHSTVWLTCVVSLAGLVMLSDTNDGLGHFAIGDLLCLAGALCWSIYMVRLSSCDGFDEVKMQAAKTFLLAVLYSVWFAFDSVRSETAPWLGYTNLVAWALLLYSALGPGTIADMIQQKAQAAVSAAEADVIMSMESVFSALLGRLLLGEATSLQEKLGGGLIIIAAVVAMR